MKNGRRFFATFTAIAIIFTLGMPGFAAETKVTAPKNPYSPDKDVELGRQAAMEVEHKMRLLNDPQIDDYVSRVGRRLAESIPPEFQHPQFRYTYKVVDVKDINAFALPGGFTFVNRGLIEAASNEGELAGVIAHEISHAALRHGTAQVAKAQKYQGLALGGAILGTILGGGAGAAVYQGTQLGVGSVLLRFSRDYEKQADILGAHIMANAGYDPRDLANMFRTIERQTGSGGPQWLSDHPNPGNRYEYINKEAELLGVKNATRDTPEFQEAKARLTNARYRSTDDIYGRRRNDPYDRDRDRTGSTGRIGGRVEPPSQTLREFSGGNYFRIGIPDNWNQTSGGESVTFAPAGAYGEIRGQSVFTHGAMIGIAQAQSRNLRQSTDAFLNSLAQGNRNLRKTGTYENETVGGRQGLSVLLSNTSEANGRPEVLVVLTSFLRSGELFYFIGVAPESEYRNYERTFQRMVQSIELR